MSLAKDDADALLGALESGLRFAGHADAADQIRRVASEPLHRDELDDGVDDQIAPQQLELELENDEDDEDELAHDEMLQEPTSSDRVSAAIKIIDLMVTEPLRIEQRLPELWARAGLDVAEMRVGEGTAAVLISARPTPASAQALAEWNAILGELRQLVD